MTATATLLHLRRAAARAATASACNSTSTLAAASTLRSMCRPVVSTSASLVLRGANANNIRSFQTSAALLKQHTTDVTKGAKRNVAAAIANKQDSNDSDDDDDAGSNSDSDDVDSDDDDSDDDAEPAAIDAANPASEYIGVVYYPTKVKKYSAELEIDGHVISGGDFWTALDAAKSYDELVALYCDLDTPRNFPTGLTDDAEDAAAGLSVDATAAAATTEWDVPEVGKRHADIIPPIPQTYLTIDEVVTALANEKALDVYTIDLAGKSSLAEHMVFATGKSHAHMRRIADLLIASMRARAMNDEFEYAVEGRDCDDWMIADCHSIVVHVMRADTRRMLDLEDHWEHMVNDKHSVYGDMTEDEYMDKFGTSELMEYLDDDDNDEAEGGKKKRGEEENEGSGVEWK